MYQIIDRETFQAIAQFDYYRQALRFMQACTKRVYIVNTLGIIVTI
jgi:hypothetical protein